MDGWLKQSTAATVKVGPFVDDGDGTTAETSLTIQKANVRLSKNGGDFAAANADQGESDAGAPHDELGMYDVLLDATDTATAGRLDLVIKRDGALVARHTYMVVPANVYDSLIAGDDKLNADVTQWAGANVTAGAVPSAAAGAPGGLPTVDANNYVAGMQGTINTLDALDAAQDDQHTATRQAIAAIAGVVDSTAEVAAKIGGMLVADGELYKFTEHALELAPVSAGDAPNIEAHITEVRTN